MSASDVGAALPRAKLDLLPALTPLIVAAIRELHSRVKPQKVAVVPPAFDEAMYKQMQQQYGEKLRDAVDTQKHPKSESYSLVDGIKAEIIKAIPEEKLASWRFHNVKPGESRDGIAAALHTRPSEIAQANGISVGESISLSVRRCGDLARAACRRKSQHRHGRNPSASGSCPPAGAAVTTRRS